MTTSELIAELQKLPPDMPVFFGEGDSEKPGFPAASIEEMSLEDAISANSMHHSLMLSESYDPAGRNPQVAFILDA